MSEEIRNSWSEQRNITGLKAATLRQFARMREQEALILNEAAQALLDQSDAIAAECEACAKLCEDIGKERYKIYGEEDPETCASAIAAAIRARGQTT